MRNKALIPFGCPSFLKEGKKYVNRALDSSWISGGGYLDKFEQDFCSKHGMPGLAVSSGSAALFLSLAVLDLKNDDEVIVPGYAFAACANMVLALGAKVVYANIDPQTWCLNPVDAIRRLTPKTKAIIAVHVYGHMCNMPLLRKLKGNHKAVLIEDAAEALFSSFNGRLAGTWGDLGCFSFQAAKTITTGEGGFVLSRLKTVAKRMRILRDYGMNPNKRYWHDGMGFNFRLTNLQAALGCAQWERQKTIIAQRKQIFQWYIKIFNDLSGIERQKSECEHEVVPWAFAVKIDTKFFKFSRGGIIQQLNKAGIESRPGFHTFHQMPFYRGTYFEECENVSRQTIVLPLYPRLKQKQLKYIAKILRTCQ